MYKKKLMFVCVGLFLRSLKKKKKITTHIWKGEKIQKLKKKKKKDSRRKKNLDLIFHILHSLTSGSTWDNTLDQQSLKKPQNNNNNII